MLETLNIKSLRYIETSIIGHRIIKKLQISTLHDTQWFHSRFASHSKGWVFETQQRHTEVIKAGSDSLATGISVTCPWR